MEDIIKLNQELERTKLELAILYEVSNAMRTTLKLDEILYIILTGVTSHTGLGFNRAILFLINDKDQLIEGRMGIGPESGEEAKNIWSQIETQKMDLDDLIGVYKVASDVLDYGFNQQVKRLKFSLTEQKGELLGMCVFDGIPIHLTKETIRNYLKDPIIELFKFEELVAVPLKAKDKVNGLILADNFVTRKPITKDDIRMLIMLSNQAGLAIENSRLFELTDMRAHTDSLTDLWNHGYFQYILHEGIEKAKINKFDLSLIAIDIDDFKVYNDTLGHQAGDKILKDLSYLLKAHSRKMDFVCRYGGEEFMIILPQTGKMEALAIAERLRQDIEKYRFTHEEILPHKKLTVSIGVAGFPLDGASPSDLISYSDKALYAAKKKGKNTTCG